MLLRFALLVLAALSLAAGESQRYDGHRVYRMVPANMHHVHFLNEIAAKYHKDVLFWKDAGVVNMTTDMMVSPQMQQTFLEALEKNGIKPSVYVEDVQKLIDNERPANKSTASFDWKDYHTLDEIYAWLDSLAEAYPGVVTTVVGGSSYEGRDIKGVKISYGTGKPAVVIESGIHGREWIAPATVTWCSRAPIPPLGASLRASTSTSSLAATQTHTYTPGQTTACGEKPVSHTGGALVPTPAATGTSTGEQAMAERSAYALSRRYGTHYEVGSIVNLIHPAAGNSNDWAMGVLGVPYSFVWQLRDSGQHGFILPAQQIIPSGEETFASLLYILHDVLAAKGSEKQIH